MSQPVFTVANCELEEQNGDYRQDGTYLDHPNYVSMTDSNRRICYYETHSLPRWSAILDWNAGESAPFFHDDYAPNDQEKPPCSGWKFQDAPSAMLITYMSEAEKERAIEREQERAREIETFNNRKPTNQNNIVSQPVFNVANCELPEQNGDYCQSGTYHGYPNYINVKDTNQRICYYDQHSVPRWGALDWNTVQHVSMYMPPFYHDDYAPNDQEKPPCSGWKFQDGPSAMLITYM